MAVLTSKTFNKALHIWKLFFSPPSPSTPKSKGLTFLNSSVLPYPTLSADTGRSHCRHHPLISQNSCFLPLAGVWGFLPILSFKALMLFRALETWGPGPRATPTGGIGYCDSWIINAHCFSGRSPDAHISTAYGALLFSISQSTSDSVFLKHYIPSNLCSLWVFFCLYLATSTPSMGLKLMTPRPRVSCSSYWASQDPLFLLFCISEEGSAMSV